MKRSQINKAIKKYRIFNAENPKSLKKLKIKSGPFIRIGPVPLVTYMSKKQGKLRAYKHETKKMPVLYYDDKQNIGILVGGSMKVKKWLEG